MKNFLVHDDSTRAEMLESIGLRTIEDLFCQIPANARMSGLELGNPLSEMECQKQIKALSKKNNTDYVSFVGGGIYNKFIPAAISQVAGRFEFLTAYTPYQAEIAQGTLQIMYEFQTMMCRLTGMDIANATVYDGASACAEAILMAVRIAKKNKVLVSEKLNPEYLKVIKTYTWAGGIEVEYFSEFPENTSEYAAVLIQTPDYYGEIAEISAVDCLLIVCCDISTLSILKPPCEYGADIVAADIQTLGMPMSFGGPHAGNQAFTLTIQTREQHIKREKATSNICSNQALMGLWAALYLSLLGEKGFRQAGYLSAKNAHVLSDKLAYKGIKTLNKNFFNEFVIEVEDADKFLIKLKSANIIGGIRLDKQKILVAATEMNTDEEIDLYVKSLP